MVMEITFCLASVSQLTSLKNGCFFTCQKDCNLLMPTKLAALIREFLIKNLPPPHLLLLVSELDFLSAI